MAIRRVSATVETLAPRDPIDLTVRDGDFQMTAKQRTLPRGTPWDERALALARRLIPDLPPWLNPPTTEKHWIMLWACIGGELAEKEPEFAWGKGRRPGSKSSIPLSNEPDAIRQRRSRASRHISDLDLPTFLFRARRRVTKTG